MWAWIVSNLVFFKNVAEHKENFYWISQEIVETSATIKCERHERCTPFSITFLCLWKRQINNKHVHTKDSEFNAVIKGAGQKIPGKDKIVNIFSFTNHMISVMSTQVCHCIKKIAIDDA